MSSDARLAMMLLAMHASACFHPRYCYPACGPRGECPRGYSCDAQGFCEGPQGSCDCDPTGVFDSPVPLPGFDTGSIESVSRFSADELELYFAVTRSASPQDYNIYRAQRTTMFEPFGSPEALPLLNTTASEYDPSVSTDGMTLFFSSDRAGGLDLYISTRASRDAEFGSPSTVPGVNSGRDDAQAFVTADRQELWFASNRDGGLGDFDIYEAVLDGNHVSKVVGITALSTSSHDWMPVLSADKLTVYLASYRPDGLFDIRRAHRSTATDGFPAATPVPELNSPANELPAWLSPDSCRIYLTSDRAGNSDIYVASRYPR